MGQEKPDTGYINIKDGVRIGYYNQHFDQHLPFDQTPVDFLSSLNNDIDKQKIRGYLGKINLESSAHFKLIGELF